jgi:protein-disulfide isomerase
VPADNNRSGGGGNRPGSKRDAARRRIAEQRAAEAASRARETRRRRTIFSGVAAGVVLVIALVVVFAVQSSRTSTSSTAAAPTHTIENGMVIPVTAATSGSSGAASTSSSGGPSPVVVNLYEDLQCPNCRAFEAQSGSTLAQLMAQGTVVLHYHEMAFLDSSANDNFATRALNAAAVVTNAAGDQAFQKFHDLVYAHQTPESGPGMTDAQLISYANQAGATGSAVSDAIKNLKYQDWTKKVTEQASKDGVTGTPTVIIGGKPLTDLSPSGVQAAVQSARNS